MKLLQLSSYDTYSRVLNDNVLLIFSYNIPCVFLMNIITLKLTEGKLFNSKINIFNAEEYNGKILSVPVEIIIDNQFVYCRFCWTEKDSEYKQYLKNKGHFSLKQYNEMREQYDNDEDFTKDFMQMVTNSLGLTTLW